MFDISWGEIAVLTSAGLILIGRKDLPIASHALGQQIGRIVGLFQGARIRADRYANDHQLKQLQNEFKSGLRELDAVKAELAGSMLSSSQVVGGGGNLGALVSSVDKKKKNLTQSMNGGESMIGGSSMLASSGLQSSMSNSNVVGSSTIPPSPIPQQSSNNMNNMGAEYLAAAQQAESAQNNNNNNHQQHTAAYLAPRSQSVAAVAEEEWEKRGIGFKSIAESGGQIIDTHDMHSSSAIGGSGSVGSGGGGGATILSNYIRQSLIYDQYERTVREQDEALRSRVDKVRNERIMNKNNDKGE